LQAAFAAGHILRQFDEVHFHEGLAENHPAGRFLEAEHRLHLIVFGKLSKLRDGDRIGVTEVLEAVAFPQLPAVQEGKIICEPRDEAFRRLRLDLHREPLSEPIDRLEIDDGELGIVGLFQVERVEQADFPDPARPLAMQQGVEQSHQEPFVPFPTEGQLENKVVEK